VREERNSYLDILGGPIKELILQGAGPKKAKKKVEVLRPVLQHCQGDYCKSVLKHLTKE